MYLKSLEVNGFKAFAHKIKFDFHNGITGIVGPNGSGKSNVADAVRWVLGEQSAKQLRGSSMQDVIFSGTENRKPLSAATVSITLDNSDHQLPIDYTEVTVTRRVFRSGESEYLINGSPCRLKDVNELFYDTGIGKDGYSIIGQGQIDRVLSGRPEERRELFDEAAGIVKFKRRKVETIKKLENERANLIRINDILGEIENQLGPLERQSEKAKAYLKSRSELQTLEVNLFLMNVEKVSAQLKDIEEKGNITEAELKDVRDNLSGIKAEYEKMETDLENMDSEIDSIKNEMSNTTLLKGKLEGQIKLLEEQIRSAKTNDELYKNREANLNKERAEKLDEKAKYDSEQEEIEKNLAEMSEKLKNAQEDLRSIRDEISKANASIEAGKNEMIDLLNKKGVIKAKQQKYDTMLEQINIRKAQLNQRLLQKRSDEEQMNKTLTDYEEAYNRTLGDIKVKEEQLSSMNKKMEEWSRKLRETTTEMEQVSIAYHKAEQRAESLRNLAERYDGYGNSVRRVMEQQSENKGLIGVVADIISVDKKYEVAIETALGGNIQNIVTTDEATAKKMVDFLKVNKLGRATFLPLTSVTGRPDDRTEEALQEKGLGILGRADHLVNSESRFSDIMEYLLCRVIVVDHIDNALKLAKKYNYALRIVTLEGESLNTGGSITGGAFKNNSNLLGRNRELEDVEKEIKELEKKRKELSNRIDEIETAKEFLADDKSEAGKKLEELRLESNTARMNVENARRQKEESDNLYADLAVENNNIDTELNSVNLDIDKSKDDMFETERREQEIKDEAVLLQEILDEKMYMEEEALKLVSKLQVDFAGVEQKDSFAKANQERVNNEIAKIDEEIAEVTGSLNLSDEDIKKKQNDIEEIYKSISAGDDSFAALEEKLKEVTLKKEKMNEEHKTFFERREELTNKEAELDKEVYRLNAQKERLNEGLESETNHMWEEYELTLHAAMKLRSPEYNDAPAMKRSANGLREEIKKLGDVNVGAIEEYKELSERYTFMNEQREDLIKAEANLVSVIEELDTGMRKQFTERFAQIQKEFDKVFKELFGGGKGTILLDENADILECGITINAQPPGKNVQNMMILSGGERALTAICLLFAIQNLKPSPFCLLDEIEAALDDSNVSRFAKYLNKLTKNTQFIVITHRRGTMSAADRLYGITMQEKGVSALVSVNLIEEDLE
ncbi:MAG: chromosome segregation protein SMC [Lachnospiraceae bacterium]|nr:chromosome segregation protein SMC [Lachnospiraceae bacterium]